MTFEGAGDSGVHSANTAGGVYPGQADPKDTTEDTPLKVPIQDDYTSATEHARAADSDTEITATELLAFVFGTRPLDRDESVLVAIGAKYYVPPEHPDWQRRVMSGNKRARNPMAHYFCPTTVERRDKLLRRRETARTAYAIVLDDVGTKVRPSAVPVAPSWRLETSAGNYQWGYRIEPTNDLEAVEGFLHQLADAGLTDGGCKDVTHLFKVPGSPHVKTDFTARISSELNFADPWPLAELVGAFDMDPAYRGTQTRPTGKGGGVHVNTNDDDILRRLDALGMVIGDSGGDFIDIVCPWAAVHSTGTDRAGYSPFGRGEGWESVQGFKCMHDHCSDRTVADLREYLGAAAPAKVDGQDEDIMADVVIASNLAARLPPDRKWLIPHWFPWGYVSGLYGPPGFGKSQLLLQLANAAATNTPWLGLLTTQPVKTFAWFCEDDADELHRRQHAIVKQAGIEYSDQLAWESRLGKDNVIATASTRGIIERTPVFDLLREQVRDLRAQFVLLDTVADVFGGNENVRTQVRQFLTMCLGRLAQEIDGAVVFAAHPSLTGVQNDTGTSGSTAWEGGVRSRLYLSKDKDNEDTRARILGRKKANYADVDSIDLHWEDGVFLRDGEIFAGGGVVHESNIEMEYRRQFLAQLDKRLKQGRTVSSHPNAANYGPRLFARELKVSPKHMNQAMEQLFAQGAILGGMLSQKGARARTSIVRCST